LKEDWRVGSSLLNLGKSVPQRACISSSRRAASCSKASASMSGSFSDTKLANCMLGVRGKINSDLPSQIFLTSSLVILKALCNDCQSFCKAIWRAFASFLSLLTRLDSLDASSAMTSSAALSSFALAYKWSIPCRVYACLCDGSPRSAGAWCGVVYKTDIQLSRSRDGRARSG
jgi:hypothetical protein